MLREEIIALDPEAFKSSHVQNMAVAERNLLDIKAIFDSQGITFWLWFGTFLGVYRGGALIPWDGDKDLAIYAADLPRWHASEMVFLKYGFMFSRSMVYRNHEHTDIAIFYPHEHDSTKWVAGPLEVDAEDFTTPNTVDFLDEHWRIPSNPERWLKYLYGSNWRTPDRNTKKFQGFPLGAEVPIIDRSITSLVSPNRVEIYYCGETIIRLGKDGELETQG